MLDRKTIKIATNEELRDIMLMDIELHRASARAIKSLYSRQGWTPQLLHKKIPGVSAGEWAAYAQKSKKSPRWLHVIAALGWAGQVSMPVFYSCEKFKKAWPELDADIIEVLVASAALASDQFDMFVRVCADKLPDAGMVVLAQEGLDKLRDYSDADFHMVEPLDIDAFGFDYNRSVGKKLREFREVFGLTRAVMARILNVTVAQYVGFESPDRTTSIPMNLAMRLKFGFHLEHTAEFVSCMTDYPGFHTSRQVQQLREDIVVGMCRPLAGPARRHVAVLAQNILFFRQKNLLLK